MFKSILSAFSGLLEVIGLIMGKLKEDSLKAAGRNEVVIAQLQDDKKAGHRADEIDTDSRTADLAELHSSMSKYQRD